MKIRSFSVLFDMCLDFIRGLADLKEPVIDKSKLLWVTFSTSQGPKNRHMRTWQGISNCQCARFYLISNKSHWTLKKKTDFFLVITTCKLLCLLWFPHILRIGSMTLLLFNRHYIKQRAMVTEAIKADPEISKVSNLFSIGFEMMLKVLFINIH